MHGDYDDHKISNVSILPEQKIVSEPLCNPGFGNITGDSRSRIAYEGCCHDGSSQVSTNPTNTIWHYSDLTPKLCIINQSFQYILTLMVCYEQNWMLQQPLTEKGLLQSLIIWLLGTNLNRWCTNNSPLIYSGSILKAATGSHTAVSESWPNNLRPGAPSRLRECTTLRTWGLTALLLQRDFQFLSTMYTDKHSAVQMQCVSQISVDNRKGLERPHILL